jgi:hypothetical protein
MTDSNPNTTVNTALEIEHRRPGLWIVGYPRRGDRRHQDLFTIELGYDHEALAATYRIVSRARITHLSSMTDALEYCRTCSAGRAPPP